MITNNNKELNTNKLAELIVFFASESKTDRLFGSIKLNKLLFLADFLSYGYRGRSITGAMYIRQERGPTPSPNQFLPVRDELIGSGRLEITLEETIVGNRKRPVAKDSPNLAIFDKDEIAFAYEALESLKHMSNTDSKIWSHKFIGWQYTKDGEVIPYQSVYMWQKASPTSEGFQWARETAIKIGLGHLVYGVRTT